MTPALPRPASQPFSFLFPPPLQPHQKLRYKDAPRGRDESRVFLVNRPPHPGEEAVIEALVEQGYYLLGICAFENWPARIANPVDGPLTRGFNLFETPYYRRFVGFMHHFREPRDVFPDDLPLLDLDFSDFVQVRKKGREKVYDLVYYAGHKIDDKPVTVEWSAVIKQHELARDLIAKLLATDADVRICLVHDSFGFDDPRVTRFDFLGYRDFLDKIEASRIMLVPSVLDASPRVITEALCLDTYVMVNEQISGGWKYVNPVTGAFFDKTNSLEVYRRLRARGPAETRAWFLRNYANHVLEDRFNAWLNQAILAYCAFNRFGRVFTLSPEGAADRHRAARRELFGHMGIYGDRVERLDTVEVPGNPRKARALSQLAALRLARETGLPDVVIFEDDFQFFGPRQAANRKLRALDREFPAWDVILLGNRTITAHEATHDAAVRRVLGASLPHGYAVRARVYDELIAGLSAACDALRDQGDGPGEGAAGLDEVWTRLSRSAQVHAFRDPIGEGLPPGQRPDGASGQMGASCLDGGPALADSPGTPSAAPLDT
jgi:hypothetical protein